MHNAVMDTVGRPILSIEGATLRDGTGQAMGDPLDFSILEGEHWAICGDSEQFSSQLLQLIAGKIISVTGSVRRFYAQRQDTVKSHNHQDLVSYMSLNHRFRNKSNLRVFYYQQRFNSMDAEEAWTVSEYLSGIPVRNPRPCRWDPETAMDLLGLGDFRDESVIKLSNGEIRRLLLAAALVKNPELLILDHPLSGLDQETRERFPGILRQIMDSGIQVIMQTPVREIPDGITHVCLIMGQRIRYAGPRTSMPGIALPAGDSETEGSGPAQNPAISDDPAKSLSTALDALITGSGTNPQEQHPAGLHGDEPLVRMHNVQVRYGDKTVLDGINWTIRPGEAWLLSGHNGAGKSTLLSLINGDNPQAYRNEIYLFGRRRGSGDSIWDIKKQIGYISPEFHQYFPKQQNLLQVVLSGFYDTAGLFRKTNEKQQQEALAWLIIMGLDHLKTKRLSQVTADQQRLTLLGRALVKKPRLLILDEPVQGLQPAQKDLFKRIIGTIHQKTDVALIYVSHYSEDIPDCVTKRLYLNEGKM